MRLTSLIILAWVFLAPRAHSAEVLYVYGPGGPAPAMREAAAAFKAKTGVDVVVDAGPTQQWAGRAVADADVIFSGSEAMMSDFSSQFAGVLDPETIEPLYVRPAALLVRPGNPERISGVRDLLKPGHRILVVTGSGQQGLWEDVVGRTGRVEDLAAFRSSIAFFARTSAEAKAAWVSDPTLDAWLIWNIWQVANPRLADVAPMEPELRIWRDTDAALTLKGEKRPQALQFLCFLHGHESTIIFQRWGWAGPNQSHASCAR